MTGLDTIFDSFGLYILGLVLLFGSYDIFLRVWHGHGERKISLLFSSLFLLTMGLIFLALSLLFLAKLYADHQILFYSGVVIFLAMGGVTFQVMKWKRQIMSEDQKMAAGFRDETSEAADQSKAGQVKSDQPESSQAKSGQTKPSRDESGQGKSGQDKGK